MTVLLLAALCTNAQAQETIDIGVIRDSDISVVQKNLYPKAGRSEMGVHLGVMPFDAYTTTPMGALTYGSHLSEVMAWEVWLGGGYGLKNQKLKELEGPAYGVAPDAYRYLGSLTANVEWAPVYAKMNWRGTRIIHHDVYFNGGAGATFEQAILPDHAASIAPTLGVGVGLRLFTGEKGTIRIQLRDDLLMERRSKTADLQTFYLKQNVAFTVGYTALGKKK